jgi:pimeloyl-ACP methyl ester carboxylesterase
MQNKNIEIKKFKYQKRDIGYLDLGPKKGRPVFFFHGFPGSSYQALAAYEYLKNYNMRLIAFDRPGYGYSSPAPKYHYNYLLEATQAYIREQGFNKVNLLGVSGGAPYAIAAAAQWGSQVDHLAVVCGLNVMTPNRKAFYSEFQKHGLRLARFVPAWQLEILINYVLNKHYSVDSLDNFFNGMDSSDQSILKKPDVRHLIVRSMEIANLHGPKGIIFDAKNYSCDWKINLKDIEAKTFIFHGDQDRVLNYRMAEELAECIPKAHLKIFRGEGHYSLPISKMKDILTTILKVNPKIIDPDLEDLKLVDNL